MAKYIQQLGHTKTWYPHWESIQMRFEDESRFVELIKFIDESEWDGVASVISGSKETDQNGQQDEIEVENCMLVCDVIVLRKPQAPILICCIRDTSGSERNQEELDTLVGYALCRGRLLKRQYLLSTVNRTCQSTIFHFEIEVLLVPTEGDITQIWDSRWTYSQPVSYPVVDGEAMHSIVCNGLAEWLLKTRHAVKDRYGDILTEHLTEAQAKILFSRSERVLVVSGKSGTGKTVIALHLVQEALSQGTRDEDVLYICSNDGLAAFVKSQVSCQVMVLKKADCLPQRDDLKRKLVILDDIHGIKLPENWKAEWERLDSDCKEQPTDIYMALFLEAAHCTKVAIFFDPDQDYEENLPADFATCLRSLAEKVDGISTQDVQVITLTERIRNSREINRFMQANQNQARVPEIITCLNEEEGDDVVYEYIGRNLEESANLLNEKLAALEKKYLARSIAILCDDRSQLDQIQSLLTINFHRAFQPPGLYPVHQMTLCSLEDFGGMEADVVLFLLPPNVGSDAVKVIWKYINVISSRAKQRLEFLLPWEPTEHQNQNEQPKITSLLELFKTVSGV